MEVATIVNFRNEEDAKPKAYATIDSLNWMDVNINLRRKYLKKFIYIFWAVFFEFFFVYIRAVYLWYNFVFCFAKNLMRKANTIRLIVLNNTWKIELARIVDCRIDIYRQNWAERSSPWVCLLFIGVVFFCPFCFL